MEIIRGAVACGVWFHGPLGGRKDTAKEAGCALTPEEILAACEKDSQRRTIVRRGEVPSRTEPGGQDNDERGAQEEHSAFYPWKARAGTGTETQRYRRRE